MGTIDYIKHKITEVKPVLEDSTQVIMDCLEQLRTCGILSEELSLLANSIESLERATQELNNRLMGFKEYESLNNDEY